MPALHLCRRAVAVSLLLLQPMCLTVLKSWSVICKLWGSISHSTHPCEGVFFKKNCQKNCLDDLDFKRLKTSLPCAFVSCTLCVHSIFVFLNALPTPSPAKHPTQEDSLINFARSRLSPSPQPTAATTQAHTTHRHRNTMATPMETDNQPRDQQQLKPVPSNATGYALPWVREGQAQTRRRLPAQSPSQPCCHCCNTGAAQQQLSLLPSLACVCLRPP